MSQSARSKNRRRVQNRGGLALTGRVETLRIAQSSRAESSRLTVSALPASSKSYSFSGQVGDLPSSKQGFDFGMAAHRGTLTGLNTNYGVFLVDYWLKNVE